jgi:hypothetical protein
VATDTYFVNVFRTVAISNTIVWEELTDVQWPLAICIIPIHSSFFIRYVHGWLAWILRFERRHEHYNTASNAWWWTTIDQPSVCLSLVFLQHQQPLGARHVKLLGSGENGMKYCAQFS